MLSFGCWYDLSETSMLHVMLVCVHSLKKKDQDQFLSNFNKEKHLFQVTLFSGTQQNPQC